VGGRRGGFVRLWRKFGEESLGEIHACRVSAGGQNGPTFWYRT